MEKIVVQDEKSAVVRVPHMSRNTIVLKRTLMHSTEVFRVLEQLGVDTLGMARIDPRLMTTATDIATRRIARRVVAKIGARNDG